MGACASNQRDEHLDTIEVLREQLTQTQSVAKVRAESICSLRNERDKLKADVKSLNNTVLDQEGHIDELLTENEMVRSSINSIYKI